MPQFKYLYGFEEVTAYINNVNVVTEMLERYYISFVNRNFQLGMLM